MIIYSQEEQDRMITIFHLFHSVATVGMAAAGFLAVREHGVGWALLAACAGGYLGFRVGAAPFRLVIRHERRKMAALSVDDLQRELQNILARPPGWNMRFTPNFLLMDLMARGQDVACHTHLVLCLMESDVPLDRALGYGAVLTAYPKIKTRLGSYSPSAAAATCKESVARLRTLMTDTSAKNGVVCAASINKKC